MGGSLSFPKKVARKGLPWPLYICVPVRSTFSGIFPQQCCRKWISPPTGSLECSPNCSVNFVSESRVFFVVKWLMLQKRFGGGFPHYSLHLSPKWLLLDKKFFGGFSQLCLAFFSQFLPEVKVAWIDDMSQPYKSSLQKTTHHVFAVGVFFGLMVAFGGFPPTAFWKGHEARIFQWSVGATRCSSTVHEEHMELVKGPVPKLNVARDGIWLCGMGRIPRHISTWSCYDPQHVLSWLSL